jgi:hypothetical protein
MIAFSLPLLYCEFLFCPVAQGLLSKKRRRGDRDGTILPWYQGSSYQSSSSLVTNTTEFVWVSPAGKETTPYTWPWTLCFHNLRGNPHPCHFGVRCQARTYERQTDLRIHKNAPESPSSCPNFVLQQRALHKLKNHRHLTLKQSVIRGSY